MAFDFPEFITPFNRNPFSRPLCSIPICNIPILIYSVSSFRSFRARAHTPKLSPSLVVSFRRSFLVSHTPVSHCFPHSSFCILYIYVYICINIQYYRVISTRPFPTSFKSFFDLRIRPEYARNLLV